MASPTRVNPTPISQPQITENPRIETHKEIEAFEYRWMEDAKKLPSDKQEGFRTWFRALLFTYGSIAASYMRWNATPCWPDMKSTN